MDMKGSVKLLSAVVKATGPSAAAFTKFLVSIGSSVATMGGDIAVVEVLTVICDSVMAQVDAIENADAMSLLVKERCEGLKDLMSSLLEAEFPADCPFFERLILVMADIAAASAKWNGFGKWKKRVSMSWSHGKSNAAKYQAQFNELFAMLDRTQTDLFSAVIASSHGNLNVIRQNFAARSLEQQNALSMIIQKQAAICDDFEKSTETLEAMKASIESMEQAILASQMQMDSVLLKITSMADSNSKPAAASDQQFTDMQGTLKRIEAAVGSHAMVLAKVNGYGEDLDQVKKISEKLFDSFTHDFLPEMEKQGKITREMFQTTQHLMTSQLDSIESNLIESQKQMQENIIQAIQACNKGGTIPRDCILLRKTPVNKLGRGAQGSVWLATMTLDGKMRSVAVKIVPTSAASQQKALEKEVAKLSRLSHPCIVRCFGACNDDLNAETMAIFEYCPIGSLANVVHLFKKDTTHVNMERLRASPLNGYAVNGVDRGLLSEEAVMNESTEFIQQIIGGKLGSGRNLPFLRLFYDMVSALAFLAAHHIVHGDLKPDNILVSTEGKFKLCDFGVSVDVYSLVATKLAASSPQSPVSGTAGFVAPELVNGGRSSGSSDIFGLAMVLYFALTLDMPFSDMSIAAVAQAIALKKRPEMSHSVIDLSMLRLLRAMWAQDPRQRPSAQLLKGIFESRRNSISFNINDKQSARVIEFSSMSGAEPENPTDKVSKWLEQFQLPPKVSRGVIAYLCSEENGCVTEEHVIRLLQDKECFDAVFKKFPRAQRNHLMTVLNVQATDQTIDEEVTPTSPSNKVNGSISNQASLSDEIVEWVATLSIINEETSNKLLDCLCVELGCTTIDEVRDEMREEEENLKRVEAILPPAKFRRFNRLLVLKNTASTQETPPTPPANPSSPVKLMQEAVDAKNFDRCKRLQPWLEAYRVMEQLESERVSAIEQGKWDIVPQLQAEVDSFPKTLEEFEAAERVRLEKEAAERVRLEKEAAERERLEKEAAERALVSSQEGREAKALADNGTINKIMSNSHTPLTDAAENNKLDMVKALLKFGADVNAKNRYGSTALINACYNSYSSVEIVRALLAVEGIDVNAKNNGGYTALMGACISNRVEVVRALLAVEGIDVNAKDNKGRTALYYASDKPEIEALLHSAGAR